jgi:hypothetical protein
MLKTATNVASIIVATKNGAGVNNAACVNHTALSAF